MKLQLFFTTLVLSSLIIILPGCMSYTTLQSPKTLESGQVILGTGFSKPVGEDMRGFSYEFNSRIGIINRFDAGFKFVAGALYFIDGKYQIIKEPFYLSADLGWSSYSYSGNIGDDKGKTTCWYPMIIAGQDHWYVAVKRVHFSTKGEVEFFGTMKFKGNGWYSTNIVAGGIFGDKIRLIPEINLVIPDYGKVFAIPAIGLQFVIG